MYYSVPPSVIRVNSVAHIVGTVSTVILPAPGVGAAIRLLGGIVSISRTSGAAIVDEVLHDGLGNVPWQVNGLSIGGCPYCTLIIPPPGFQFAPNSPVTMDSVSTVAAGVTTTVLHYVTDDVS